MRKLLYLTLSAAYMLTPGLAHGQSKYKVTVSNGTYTDLAGATDLAYVPVDDGYYYQNNFVFPVFNTSKADFNLNVPKNSNGGFMASKGYLAVYDAPGFKNTVVFQCLYDNSHFAMAPGITKASVKLEGTAGNRIAKFQWKDVVDNQDNNQRISFQLWLHETDSSISYHYGPNTMLSQQKQSFCGIVIFDQSFTAVLNECNLEGSPTKPAVYDTFSTLALPTLDSIPKPGTIYTFKYSANTGIGTTTAGNGIHIYPNPAGEEVSIATSAANPPSRITMYNAMGAAVRLSEAKQHLTTISLSGLPDGVYSLVITSGQSQVAQKIIVQH